LVEDGSSPTKTTCTPTGAQVGGEKHESQTSDVAGDVPLEEPAGTCTGTLVMDDPARECLASDEEEKVGASLDAPVSSQTAVQINADGSELKCSDVNVTTDASTDCCEVASARGACDANLPRPWFAKPSVGTWLRILPESRDSSSCLCVVEPEMKPCHVDWRHLPSVGTWLQTKPARARSEAAAVPVVFQQPAESTNVEASCDDKVHECKQVSEPAQGTDDILQ